MKHLFFFFLLTISQISVAQEATDDTPKAVFIMTIDGKEYRLSQDELLKLDSTFTNPSISIRLAPYKTLKLDMISFDFPSYFSFEKDIDIGYKSWVLNGNNFIVMVFSLEFGSSINDFLEQLIIGFGVENCKIDTAKMTLGGKKFKGKKVTVTLVGQQFEMTVIELATKEGTSFLVFQGSPEENGDVSKEEKETLKVIDKTVRFKK